MAEREFHGISAASAVDALSIAAANSLFPEMRMLLANGTPLNGITSYSGEMWSHLGGTERQRSTPVNRFRIPIVGAMAIVALVASDCLVIRSFAVRGSRSILLVFGLLPLLDLLGIGLFLGLRDLVARRRCPTFLVGFEVLGWSAAAAYAFVCVSPLALEIATAYLGIVLGPVDTLLNRVGFVYDDSSMLCRLISDACSSAALSAPLLLCALAGGWLTRRFEIWLARGAWLPADQGEWRTA
jgi:hypothetical protein